MLAEGDLGMMHSYIVLCVNVFHDLVQFFRHSVNLGPSAAVLAVFYESQVDVVFLSDFFEVGTVAAVTAYEYALVSDLQDERSPQSLVSLEPSSREMLCRGAGERHSVVVRFHPVSVIVYVPGFKPS